MIRCGDERDEEVETADVHLKILLCLWPLG